MRVSVFTLIFKSGNECDLSNYRPISLTNVDYRIMAFVLVARLQLVIDSLISQDQTAYIKNRYMGHNIRLIEDVIDHFDKLQMKGLMCQSLQTSKKLSIVWIGTLCSKH